MFIGFVIWSAVAVIFLGIGINARKAKEPAGFFTFAKPPEVRDVKGYNRAVSILWMAAAAVLEALGIPFLILRQNSPAFVLVTLAVMALVIAMAVIYMRIEAKYRK